jgi:hypothetical protein
MIIALPPDPIILVFAMRFDRCSETLWRPKALADRAG